MALLTDLRSSFRALRYRNYRLFFTGQSISLIGSWMQRIAMGWLVYRLTNSALMLGLVGFAGQIPSLLVSPFAGVLIDRLDRRRILIVTQSLALLQAATLSVLVLTGMVNVWWILGLSIFMGFVDAWDHPVRQAFNIDMVEKRDDVPNAIALNSTMFNMARLIGPTVAGILISLVGEGFCFLINALSYVAVLISLFMMVTKPQRQTGRGIGLIESFKDGARYAFGFMPIRTVLLMLALFSFMGMPYTVLMPVFARDILHGGPSTMGFLVSSVGLGALTGAMFLATRKSAFGLWRVTPLTATLFGIGLIVFSLSRHQWLSFMLMYFVGFGAMVSLAGSNTILQTIVAEDKRGRVMSFQTMANMGMTPLGSLWTGVLAARIGAPNTLLVSGGACILGAAVFAANLPVFVRQVTPLFTAAAPPGTTVVEVDSEP
jgi:MFS family permease